MLMAALSMNCGLNDRTFCTFVLFVALYAAFAGITYQMRGYP